MGKKTTIVKCVTKHKEKVQKLRTLGTGRTFETKKKNSSISDITPTVIETEREILLS
jgi:hypothetical protein